MRLRWELSKTWGRPLHDSVFDEIPPIHWAVYAQLLSRDRKETMEWDRDKIEYMARFWDNKAVNEIQRIREAKNQSASDKEFEAVLMRNFGKPIGDVIDQRKTIEQLGAEIDQANR